MMIIRLIFTSLCLLLFVQIAHAIMPPMPEAQAIEWSNVVVDAQTLEVTKMGEEKDSGCMAKTPYQAKLKVIKVYKGKPKDTLILHYTKK
ncbi:hypothetical protein KJ708_01120 [bacterium]|nr:hypothetical protein [bacterium]MBU1916979.1 hypothetical protein [bacterium]